MKTVGAPAVPQIKLKSELLGLGLRREFVKLPGEHPGNPLGVLCRGDLDAVGTQTPERGPTSVASEVSLGPRLS